LEDSSAAEMSDSEEQLEKDGDRTLVDMHLESVTGESNVNPQARSKSSDCGMYVNLDFFSI
jgi:hypothetical protein